MARLPRRESVRVDRYVVEVLMRDLVGHDHQPAAFLVYLFFHARPPTASALTEAADPPAITASVREIAEATGLSKSAVQSALQTLRRRQLLEATSSAHPTATATYRVRRPWAND